jgi:hypothetical protein
MKRAISFMLFAILLTFLSCKKECNKSMTVVKDCTGTYLRTDGKDYHVCNSDKLESYSNGTEVRATFKKTDKCTGPANDAPVCYMLHENEGWVDVVKIE